MGYWIVSWLIPVLLILGGNLWDRPFGSKPRARIYIVLRKSWEFLQQIPWHRLLSLAAETSLRLPGLLFNKNLFIWQIVLLCFILSFSLSTLGQIIGQTMNGGAFIGSRIFFPTRTEYLLSFIFDLLSLLLAIWVLKKMAKSRLVMGLLLLVGNAVLLLGFLLFTWAFLIWSGNLAFESSLSEAAYSDLRTYRLLKDELHLNLKEGIISDKTRIKIRREIALSNLLQMAAQAIEQIIKQGEFKHTHQIHVEVENDLKVRTYRLSNRSILGWNSLFIPLSIFVPFLFYLLVWALLLLAKGILNLLNPCWRMLLQQDRKQGLATAMPGTLLGILMGLVWIVINLGFF